jgi:hypothetical protein
MSAGEARIFLKIGSTSPSLNRELLSLLTLPDERQKKTVNHIGVVTEWRSKTLGIPHESTCTGTGILPVE